MTSSDAKMPPLSDTLLRTEAGTSHVPHLAHEGSASGPAPCRASHDRHPPGACPRLSIDVFNAEQRHRMATWTRFWMLAISVDGTHQVNHQLDTCIVDQLEQTEKDRHAVWTHPQDAIYFCALPGIDRNDVLVAAQQFQERLARIRVETISIGICAFPLGTYSLSDSTINACKALDHAAFFGPGAIVVFDAVSCNISGDAYYQAGRLDMAKHEYKAGLNIDPTNVNLLNSLGVCLAKHNQLRKARAAFAAAVRHDPNEAFALYNLGVIQSIHQNQDRALEHLKKAYALNRETFEIPFQIGKILCDQGRYDQAMSYFEAALRMRRDDGTAHRFLGDCLVAAGNQTRALSAYKTAVKLNPNDAVALSALGALYAAVDENPDVCRAFLEQSVTIDPDNGLFQHRLARFYHERNHLRQALRAYEKAVDLGHDSHRQVSELRHQLGGVHP